MVLVVQREWGAKNSSATLKAPITVGDVLNSLTPIIASFGLVQFRRAAAPVGPARRAS
jgi:hypothetical protein